MDIVDEIRKFTAPHTVVDVSIESTAKLLALLGRATDEIVRLRSIAGAVSDGPKAADIYAPMRAKPKDIPGYAADLVTSFREKPIDG